MLHELRQDIEKAGGTLLGKPRGLVSNFTFGLDGNAQDSCSKLRKKYPGVDFFTRGRRLCVYGIIGL